MHKGAADPATTTKGIGNGQETGTGKENDLETIGIEMTGAKTRTETIDVMTGETTGDVPAQGIAGQLYLPHRRVLS